MPRVVVRSCALALVAPALAPGGADAEVTLTTLVLTGQPAPVGEPNVVFDGFIGAPFLATATGELLVRARLAGPQVTVLNDVALFVMSPNGEIRLLAREGDQVPGMAEGVRYLNLPVGGFIPAFNPTGVTVYTALLTGPGVTVANDNVVFAGRPGAVTALIREGDQVPGMPPGTKATAFSQGLVGASSRVGLDDRTEVLEGAGPALGSELVGIRLTLNIPLGDGLSLNGFGTLAFLADEPTLVAGLMREAPGVPSTLLFSTVGGLSLNASDQHAFISGLGVAATGAFAGSGVWAGAIDDYDLVARSGDAAPGTEAQTVFGNFIGVPLRGSQDDLIFTAGLTGPSVILEKSQGVWRHRAGVTTLVARFGDPAPEFAPTATFNTIGLPVGDASRTTVFAAGFVGAGITTANDDAIMAVDPNNQRRVVARTGEQAPGAAPGQVWVNFPKPPSVNTMGRVAFEGTLVGPGVAGTNAEGIWVIEPDGTGTLVVRGGDLVEVGPGDMREVFVFSSLLSTGIETGESRSLSDEDELVMTLTFDDLSSAIVRASVPRAVLGDLSGDGLVNGADLGLLLGQWGACAGSCSADLTGDGVVDGADLGLLLGAWTGA